MSDKSRAAERRADYVRALEDERRQCVALDQKERVKAIDAELKRVKGGNASSGRPAQQTRGDA